MYFGLLFPIYTGIRFLTNYKTFCTSRRKWAYRDVTKLDIISAYHPQILAEMCQIDVREGMKGNDGAARRRFF